MIYAIGYQKMTLGNLLSIMEAKDIRLLADVRSIPYGRKHEFNRRRLEAALGNRYVWKGDLLGGKYGPAKAEGLKWLIETGEKENVLIMCMEGHPCDCHRLYDIARRLGLRGVDVVHFYDGEKTTKEMEVICSERKKR